MSSTHRLNRGIPLRIFFTVPVLLLFLLTAGLIGFIAYLSGQHAAAQFGQKLSFQITQRTNEQLELLVSVPKTILNTTLQALEHQMVDIESESELARYLVMQISHSPYLTFVSVGLANGQYLSVNRDHATGKISLLSSINSGGLLRTRYSLQPNGLPGDVLETLDEFDARHRPWFVQALSKGEASWYPVYQYSSIEGLGVGLSAPVYIGSGQLKAVVAIDFSLSLLSTYLQSLQQDSTATVFIIGPQGNIVAASKPDAEVTADNVNKLTPATQSSNPLISAAARQLDIDNREGQHSVYYNGQNYLLNVTEYQDPQGLGFTTAVLIPQRDLLSFLDKYLTNALWLIILAIVLGALLTLMLSRRLIQPIVALHRSADQLALGKQASRHLPTSEVFELNGLIMSFDLMATKLAAAFSQLEFKVKQGNMSLQQLSSEVIDHQQRTERQRSALAQLVLDDAVAAGNSQAFASNLTRIVAEAMICKRVSVWMMSAAGNEMHCLALHQSDGDSVSAGMILKQVDYPDYFTAIAKHGWICANDALSHKATCGFAEGYLKPMGIGAMLDAGILIASKVRGVVCLEHVGGVRQWQADEEAFVGAVAAVLAQVISISQQKHAELISKESAEHTQTILNSVVDGIVTMDANGHIISMNPAAQHLFAAKEQQYLNCHITEILPVPLLEHLKSGVDFFPAAGFNPALGVLRELDGVRADGSILAIEMALSVISRQGKLIYIATVRDVSERKRLACLQNEFVSTVSHELRTPLTSITGAIALIKSGKLGELSDKATQLVAVAYKNCQSLTMLVNDLLDFEKISAGKMQFDMQPEPVLLLLEKALEANKVMAEQKRICLKLQPNSVDCSISVDALRLMQVLSNFISNAIKFSPDATTVDISASVQGHQVRIAVTDRGPGIAESFQGEIFQRFSQADSSDSRKIGGTGLGLAISKELVHGMQGTIGFDSVAGEGATFYCCFAIV